MRGENHPILFFVLGNYISLIFKMSWYLYIGGCAENLQNLHHKKGTVYTLQIFMVVFHFYITAV